MAKMDTHPYGTIHAYAWAAFNRVAYFLFVAIGATAIKRLREEFQARMEALERARELEQEIVRVSEREQMRIGQDLHDGLCQQLTALGLSLERIKRRMAEGVIVEPAQFERIQQLVRNSIADLRQVAHGLQPVNFRVGGLPHALRELAESISDRFHVTCRARCTQDADVDDQATADHLYRIAQEAAGNAVKHGKATHVLILLSGPSDAHGLTLRILDNGTGFARISSPTPPPGMGLRIMKYRADAVGADFRIRERHRNRGVAVSCVLPARRKS
jgi:signal transduction histidine kinase